MRGHVKKGSAEAGYGAGEVRVAEAGAVPLNICLDPTLYTDLLSFYGSKL